MNLVKTSPHLANKRLKKPQLSCSAGTYFSNLKVLMIIFQALGGSWAQNLCTVHTHQQWFIVNVVSKRNVQTTHALYIPDEGGSICSFFTTFVIFPLTYLASAPFFSSYMVKLHDTQHQKCPGFLKGKKKKKLIQKNVSKSNCLKP